MPAFFNKPTCFAGGCLVSIDGQIDRYDSDERTLLLQHMDKLKKGDLLLLDRGYRIGGPTLFLVAVFASG